MCGRVVVAFVLLASTSAPGCRERDTSPATPTIAAAQSPHKRELLELYAFEERRRHEIDFATLPPSERVLGPDPYRIARLGDGTRVGILRGESAIVAIDDRGAERSRIPAPR